MGSKRKRKGNPGNNSGKSYVYDDVITDPDNPREVKAHMVDGMLMGPVNYHGHSKYSDGQRSAKKYARDIYEKAGEGGVFRNGFTCAITDHYTVDGYPRIKAWLEEYLKEDSGRQAVLVPGIEVSAAIPREFGEYRGIIPKMHALGVGIDHKNPVFQDWMRGYNRMRGADMKLALDVREDLLRQGFRLPKASKISRRLGLERNVYKVLACGLLDESDNLKLLRDGYRLELVDDGEKKNARSLNEKIVVHALQQRYGRFQAEKPGVEVFDVFNQAGGYVFIPHILRYSPDVIKLNNRKMRDLFKIFGELGVGGMSAFHPDHSLEEAERIAKNARMEDLFVGADSDAHSEKQDLAVFHNEREKGDKARRKRHQLSKKRHV